MLFMWPCWFLLVKLYLIVDNLCILRLLKGVDFVAVVVVVAIVVVVVLLLLLVATLLVVPGDFIFSCGQ